MHMFTERTQVLLSKQQLSRLKRVARRAKKSVGAVIREAVDTYTTSPDEDERQAALERLVAMELPVDDWLVMKEQILRSQLGDE